MGCTDCSTKEHSDRYYTRQGSCTTVSCSTRGATEYFDTDDVYMTDTCSVATCAFGEEPTVDGMSCTDCATKLHPDRYYTTQGSCTTSLCTPSATGYFDTSAVYTGNPYSCSVATCAFGKEPTDNRLSCTKCP